MIERGGLEWSLTGEFRKNQLLFLLQGKKLFSFCRILLIFPAQEKNMRERQSSYFIWWICAARLRRSRLLNTAYPVCTVCTNGKKTGWRRLSSSHEMGEISEELQKNIFFIKRWSSEHSWLNMSFTGLPAKTIVMDICGVEVSHLAPIYFEELWCSEGPWGILLPGTTKAFASAIPK